MSVSFLEPHSIQQVLASKLKLYDSCLEIFQFLRQKKQSSQPLNKKAEITTSDVARHW